MISELRSPVYVQVEITSDCNNHCLYCYNFWKYELDGERARERKKLSMKDLEVIAKTLGDNDVFYVTVTGGEPFLEKEKLYRFLDCLCEQNIRIMINSNATLLDEISVQKISEYPIEIFLVSLISFNPKIHNNIARSDTAFKKTIEGIKLLQKYKMNIAINMVATKLNYQDVYSTGKWLYDQFNILNFSATPICPSTENHDHLELNEKEVFQTLNQLIQLRNDLKVRIDILEVLPTCLFSDFGNDNIREIVKIFSKRMCTAGNTTITIGSEGDVRVCSFDQESYGNIFTDNFQDIWNRMKKWRNNSLLPQECKNCVILDSCGGGCRVNSKIKKGNYCELDHFSKGTLKEKQDIFFSEIANISLNSTFFSLKDLSFRKEKDNLFVIMANSMYFIITNNIGLKIVKALSELDLFIPCEIINKFNLDYKIGKIFFGELFAKGFIFERR